MKMTDLINFEPKEEYIRTLKGQVHIYKISPPNIAILSKEETLFQIKNFYSLLKNMPQDTQMQILALDKSEDLSENKEYWKKVSLVNEEIGQSIIDSISKKDISGAKGVQRGFYICITIKDNGMLSRFENALKDCNMPFSKLKKQELVSLLRAYFLRDFKEFPIQVLEDEINVEYENLKKGKKKKTKQTDFYISEISKRLMPTTLNIKSNYIEQGNFLRQVLLVKNLPMVFENLCLLRRVSQVENTTLSIRISEMNRTTAVSFIDKQLKVGLTNATYKQGVEQISAQKDIEDMRDFFVKFKTDKDKMFYVNIYIELYGKTEEELQSVYNNVVSSMDDVSVEILNYEQKAGFMGVCPVCTDELRMLSNNVPGKSLSAFFPFSYSSRVDPKGMYLGKTEDGGYMFVDLLQRTSTVTNSNYFISGESGFGKSYLSKKILSQFLAPGNRRAYTFDFENEYVDLIKGMGGITIEATDVRYGINVFEIRRFKELNDENSDDDIDTFNCKTYFSQHLSWLKDQMKLLIPHLKGTHLDMMMSLIKDMYLFKGMSDDTDFSKFKSEDYPTFTDLYKYIEKVLKNKEEYPFYRLYDDKMIADCLLMLRDLYDGSLSSMFNRHTNLPNSDIINFNLQELQLGDKNRTVAYQFNIMTFVWSKILNRDKATIVHVDELYLFADEENPMPIQYLRNFMKRARKYDAVIGTATQQLADVASSGLYKYTSALFNTPSFKFLFYPGDLDVGQYKKLTGLSNSQVNILKECTRRECLVFIGKDVYKMIVGTLAYEKALFGSGGGR